MKLIDKLKAATLNEAASEQAVYASTTKGGVKLIFNGHLFKFSFRKADFSVFQCLYREHGEECKVRVVCDQKRVYPYDGEHAHFMQASDKSCLPSQFIPVTQHVRNCGPQMFLISRKGGTLLAINNFLYRSNLKFFGKSNNILYWECVQNRSVKCRSRLKTVGDDLYVTNDVHNHMGDNVRIEAAKVSGMLIHRKLSSLTSADRMQGSWKIEDEATTTTADQ